MKCLLSEPSGSWIVQKELDSSTTYIHRSVKDRYIFLAPRSLACLSPLIS